MTSSQSPDSPAEPKAKAPGLTRRAIRQAAQARDGLVEGTPPLVQRRRPERPLGDSRISQADPATVTAIPPRRPQLPRIARPESPPPASTITNGTAVLPRAEGPAWPVAPPGHDWIDDRFRRTRPVGELAPARQPDQSGAAGPRHGEPQDHFTATPLRPSLDHLSRPKVPLSRRALAQARKEQLAPAVEPASSAPLLSRPLAEPTPPMGLNLTEPAVVPPDLTNASRAAAALEAAGETAIIPVIDQTIATVQETNAAMSPGATPVKPAAAALTPPHQLTRPPVDQTGPIKAVAIPPAPEPGSRSESLRLPASKWAALLRAWLSKARTWTTKSVPVWGGVAGAAAVIVALITILGLAAGQRLGHLPPPTPGSAKPVASAATKTATPEPTPTPGQIGASKWSTDQLFISGDFSLKLLTIQTGLPELGEAGQWTAVNGAFAVLKVQVTYTGQNKGSFPPDQQRLIVAGGRAYETDIESAGQLPASPLGVDPLIANQPVTGYLAFDINEDDTPVALEFKGDFLSDTVQIPLG